MSISELKQKTTLLEWNSKKKGVLEFVAGNIGYITGKPGTPREVSLDEIKDVGEKAYQRAIWLSEETQFNNSIIRWIDLEVPVIPGGRSRRPCADLVGECSGKFVLAELKDKGGDSPLFAMYELLKYSKSIELFKNSLQFHSNSFVRNRCRKIGINDFTKFDISNISVIVAAPVSYWAAYDVELIKNLNDARDGVKDETGLYIEFAELPDEDFKQQKPVGKPYKPILQNSSLWTLL